MDAIVLGVLLVPHAFELVQVGGLLLLQHEQLLLDPLLLILQQLLLELIYLLLLILVYVVELTLLQVELTGLIQSHKLVRINRGGRYLPG